MPAGFPLPVAHALADCHHVQHLRHQTEAPGRQRSGQSNCGSARAAEIPADSEVRPRDCHARRHPGRTHALGISPELQPGDQQRQLRQAGIRDVERGVPGSPLCDSDDALLRMGQGTGGPKQAHEFHDPDDDYLWAAGIWEEHEELGPCFSMVTTAASPLMSPIHDRMPALLRPEQMQVFLSGSGHWEFQPFAGQLAVTPCESPLSKRQGSGVQGELF